MTQGALTAVLAGVPLDRIAAQTRLLAAAVDDLRAAGVDVRFACAHAGVRDYAARLGHEQLAGLVDPYPTVEAAVSKSPMP